MAIIPDNFSVNEAWLLFQLNDAPVCTELDDDFNAFAIMDVATGVICGMELVAVTESDISEFQSRKLLAAAAVQAGVRPPQLFIESDQEMKSFSAVAAAMAIAVLRAPSVELQRISWEARKGFAMHVSGGHTR